MHVMDRAYADGVDLAAGMSRATKQSWRDRLIQDPHFRRHFFSAPSSGLDCDATDKLSFRDRALGSLQEMLRLVAEGREDGIHVSPE
jgi:hypothetical protein